MDHATRVRVLAMIGALWLSAVFADEAPISGNVKAVDSAANALTIETTNPGKTREVTVDIKPTSRIVQTGTVRFFSERFVVDPTLVQ